MALSKLTTLPKDNMPLPPDLSKPAFSLFPEKADRVMANKCVTCVEPVGAFKDALSRKEYSISGMCQACQDSIFAEPEEEDDLTYEGW